MPRSSPNTEEELLEVELELQFHAPETAANPPPSFRLKPIHLVVLVPALAIGLSLVPRIDEIQPVLVPVDTLPEPAVATTAALMPAESQASLTSFAFEMVPIELGRIGTVVGPAYLNDQLWLIASSDQRGTSLVYRSTDDGVTWEQAGDIPTAAETMVPHDLESFGGSLVALGTTSNRSGPATIFGSPDQVVIWRSSDGLRWNEKTILPYDGRHQHSPLDLITDGRIILIGGQEAEIGGSKLEETIPDDLVPAVLAGKLDVVHGAFANGRLSVAAPAGIEVFRSEKAVDLPNAVSGILYRSDDLQHWEKVEVEPSLILSEMVVKPGGGFVVPSSSGDMYSAMDGRGWGRNLTIPRATYSRWGDWLVGLQSQDGLDRLVIGAGTDYSTIDPPNSHLIWGAGGQVTGGSAGLISLVPTYLGPAPAVSFTSGAQVLMLRNGMFSISLEGTSEAPRMQYQPSGSYDPGSDKVSIDLGDGREPLVLDLDDLQRLRAGVDGQWETSVYASSDGLRWFQSSIAFATPDVEVLGATPDGFLVAVGSGVGSERLIELYRTGPLPSDVNG